MPSIVSHGIIGYLLFEYEGIFWSTLPDIIGFSRYFSRIGYDYLKNIDKKKFNWPNPDLMDQTDWKLYDISHSLIFWFIMLFVLKKKEIYASIISVTLDIFLHDKKEWRGPKFLYPISEYNFDGIRWDSPLGFTITLTIITLLYFNKN
tara:strand:+ start:405 stop:848 length:444 start_codon:yes stop_codon:yes gene_type:complete